MDVGTMSLKCVRSLVECSYCAYIVSTSDMPLQKRSPDLIEDQEDVFHTEAMESTVQRSTICDCEQSFTDEATMSVSTTDLVRINLMSCEDHQYARKFRGTAGPTTSTGSSPDQH